MMVHTISSTLASLRTTDSTTDLEYKTAGSLHKGAAGVHLLEPEIIKALPGEGKPMAISACVGDLQSLYQSDVVQYMSLTAHPSITIVRNTVHGMQQDIRPSLTHLNNDFMVRVI